MSLGLVVDTAIGLVLAYLLLSIIVTGVQESVAALLASRAKTLEAGIARLIKGDATSTSDPAGDLTTLATNILGHGLVRPTHASNAKPSYIPARNFAAAVLDCLASNAPLPLFSQIEQGVAALPDGKLKQSLSVFLDQAGGDLTALQSRVETWFDDAMDRLSGEYKRNAQAIAFGIGLLIAALMNVDTLQMARTLYTSDGARTAAVSLGAKWLSKAPPKTPLPDGTKPGDTDTSLPDKTMADLAATDIKALPIGWTCPGPSRLCNLKPPREGTSSLGRVWREFTYITWSWTIPGWLITALAASLGAPFWFDTLQQLFNLRATGPKPAPSSASTGS